MARTVARLPEGIRISDHISLGVLARTVPGGLIDTVLEETGRATQERLVWGLWCQANNRIPKPRPV
jgi:hypothetical protein